MASLTEAPATPVRKTWDLYTDKQRGVLLFVLFLVSTSNYVDRNIISVLLEPIKAEFQVSDAALGLLSGLSFALFYAVLGIPVARWADRGDRKIIITAALTIWSVMTMACGMAQSFVQLALARVGVGAGEAGAIPPAQSLIADYYPPERRAKALGLFLTSATAGYLLGIVVGGWVASTYGWRMAFLIVGTPGLLLAVVVHFVLREPRRIAGMAVKAESGETAWGAFRALRQKPAYMNILVGIVLYFVVAYGALVFLLSFSIRVHNVTLAEISGIYGTISAVGTVVGSILGGWVGDRLAKRDLTWLCRLPGWGLLIAWPLHLLAFWAPNLWTMLAIFFLAGLVLACAVPTMFSALHAVCGSRRRAMAVAIVFFFANLIGLGLGPVITGLLSDFFARTHGAGEGLRYALMIVVTAFIPSGLCFLRAIRHFKSDLEE